MGTEGGELLLVLRLMIFLLFISVYFSFFLNVCPVTVDCGNLSLLNFFAIICHRFDIFYLKTSNETGLGKTRFDSPLPPESLRVDTITLIGSESKFLSAQTKCQRTVFDDEIKISVPIDRLIDV